MATMFGGCRSRSLWYGILTTTTCRLVYPMLDHRNVTPSSHAIQDTKVWNRLSNQQAWAMYLGGKKPDIYASPSTATDLGGLPPAYVRLRTDPAQPESRCSSTREPLRATAGGVAREL
eukprot:COSAG01_NODE_30579_length_613_cov_1.287938_2_plen_118_part_00